MKLVSKFSSSQSLYVYILKTNMSSLILSPERRRVLSELTSTRNTIKKKFKQAFLDRTKLERESNKVFKPIITSIEKLKPKEKDLKVKKAKIERERQSTSNPSSFVNASIGQQQPTRRSIQLTPSRLHLPSTSHAAEQSTPLEAIPSDDEDSENENEYESGNSDVDDNFKTANFDKTAISTSTPRKSNQNKRRLAFESAVKKLDSKRACIGTSKKSQAARIPRRIQRRNRLGGIDENKFTYKVVADYQNLDRYDKPLGDNAPVNVKQTSIYSGKEKILKTLWKNVPKNTQNNWLKHRKIVYESFRNALQRQNENMDIDITPKKKAVKRTSSISHKKGSKQRRENDPSFIDYEEQEDEIMNGAGVRPLDFSFIPYNADNRIVYEYFDDPNELCDRLKLLLSSKMAGNTNHIQEMNSIVEELRELGYIV